MCGWKNAPGTISDAIDGDSDLENLVVPTPFPGVELIPCSDPDHHIRQFHTNVIPGSYVFGQQLQKVGEGRDYILFDCARNIFSYEVTALMSADGVLAVAQLESDAPRYTTQLLDVIGEARMKGNPQIELTGVIVRRHNRKCRFEDMVEQAMKEAFGDALFSVMLHDAAAITNAPFGKTVFQHEAKSRAAQEYLALAHELIARSTLTH